MVSPMERVLHLKKIPLFSDLGVRELTAVASIAEEKTFPQGHVIIQEGEVGEDLYFILMGRVSVIKNMGTPQAFHLADMGPSNYFGDMALFDQQPRSASVVAQEETHLLALSRFEFDELMKEFPKIAIHACRVFSERFRELQVKFQSTSEAQDSSSPEASES